MPARTALTRIEQNTNKTARKAFRENAWGSRHAQAIDQPKAGHERALVTLLKAWAEYADAHRRRFESTVGDDGVLGSEWKQIGEAIIGLLNGEAGRLDCGTIDGLVREIAEANDSPIE
jgi:hypothetical protein